MANEAKRVGRPSKPEAEKRQQIGVRTSPQLKGRLEAAAKEMGRSVAQEAEYRLDESFALEELLGSPATKSLLIELARKIALAEKEAKASWNTDITSHRLATKLVGQAMKDARPLPENWLEMSREYNEFRRSSERFEKATEILSSAGVIADRRNALALLTQYEPPNWQPQDEEDWHYPNIPKQSLKEEDREFLRGVLAEWVGLNRGVPLLEKAMRELYEPYWAAIDEGDRIARMLTDEQS